MIAHKLPPPEQKSSSIKFEGVLFQKRRVEVGKCVFSQDSISCVFQDGRPLQDLIGELRLFGPADSVLAGREIKVVNHAGQLVGVDNRRLYCTWEALDMNTLITVKWYATPLHYAYEKDIKDRQAMRYFMLAQCACKCVRARCVTRDT